MDVPANEVDDFVVEGDSWVGGYVGAVEGEGGSVTPVKEFAYDGRSVGEGGDVDCWADVGFGKLNWGLRCSDLAKAVIYKKIVSKI